MPTFGYRRLWKCECGVQMISGVTKAKHRRAGHKMVWIGIEKDMNKNFISGRK